MEYGTTRAYFRIIFLWLCCWSISWWTSLRKIWRRMDLWIRRILNGSVIHFGSCSSVYWLGCRRSYCTKNHLWVWSGNICFLELLYKYKYNHLNAALWILKWHASNYFRELRIQLCIIWLQDGFQAHKEVELQLLYGQV